MTYISALIFPGEQTSSVSAACFYPFFGIALFFMPSCLIATAESHWAVSPLFHLFSAASITIPLPILGCTSCWLSIRFAGQALFWFSPLLSAVFLLHHFQCCTLLPLASASSSPRLSFFLALLSLKQAASWYSCTKGRVLSTALGYSFEFPLLTASLLQLPKRELSRQVFSCQLANVLRSILYFCQ